jgi:hypothetical protein
MPEVYRRVILKPAGLSAADAVRLREQLAAAVEVQRLLARSSPHVLALVGDLQEDDESFSIEHEPGRAMEVDALFSPDSPLADETVLLRTAAALADALRVASSGEQGNPIVHGGLCGGVLLQTTEGAHKLTDFGFAPAISAVLGAESYVELAVGSNIDASTGRADTGVWEVLSPDDDSRDDRICAFIDPEKYGSQTLATFESGSDIIAAGILLHLLAEHRHPMLEPGDHRSVLTAESMSWTPYNGARRKALRETSDPAMQRWCSLVADMLARIPRDRPSAADIAKSLREVGVGPDDATEALRRRLDSAVELAKSGKHAEALNLVSELLATGDLPADLADRAYALQDECRAYDLLKQARKRLSGDTWQSTREMLDELSSMSTLPARVAEQADRVARDLQRNLAIKEQLDRTEAAFREASTTDPAHALGVVRDLIDRVAKLKDDKVLVSPLRARCGQVHADLLDRRKELETAAAAVQAEHAAVNKWFANVKTSWDQENWADLEALLHVKPETPHWPKGVKTDVREIEHDYAGVKAAQGWVKLVGKALEGDKLDEAARLLAEVPELKHWPASLARRQKELAARLRTARAKADDLARARKWIQGVEQTMAGEDWAAAGRQLADKPPLEHWPPDVLEREQRYRSDVDGQLKEEERHRLEIEEANRKAAAWLQSADEAAEAGDWQRAIEILEVPPLDDKRLPKNIPREVKRRKKEFERQLRERRRKQLEERDASVQRLAAAFVQQVVAKHLPGLLDPAVVEVAVGSIKWGSEETPTNGEARLTVSVSGASDGAEGQETGYDFEFQMETAPPRIRDDEDTIRKALAENLTRLVHQTQETRAAELATPWQRGLFPEAKVDLALGEPLQRTTASIDLCAGTVRDARFKTEFTWDPKALNWKCADARALKQRALQVAKDAAYERVRAQVFERSDTLNRYRHVVLTDLAVPVLAADAAVPAPLQLRCELTIEDPDSKERHPLFGFSVTCPRFGTIAIDADLTPAEHALERWLVSRQDTARATMERHLKERISAAPGRIKLAVGVKRIKRPVDQLGFELKPKRGDRLPIAARWNPKTLDFELSQELKARIEEVLRGPAVPVETEARVASPAPQGSPPEPTPANRRRPKRAFALASGAAAVVLVVLFVVLGQNSDRQNGPPPPPVPNGGNSVDGGNSGNAETVVRSLEEAMQEVREVLAKSRYLRPYVDRLVECVPTEEERAEKQEDSTAEKGSSSVQCVVKLPGLTEPERQMVLSLRDTNAMTAKDRTFLEDGWQAVDKLLDDAATAVEADVKRELVDMLMSRQARDDPLFDADQVHVHLDSEPEWELDDDTRGWHSLGAVFTVSLTPAQSSGEPETPKGTEDSLALELSNLTTNLTARGGIVQASSYTEAPGAIDDLARSVLDKLRTRQTDLLAEVIDNIGAQHNDWNATYEASETPRTSVTLKLEVEELQPRELTIEWNAASLSFADTWSQDVERIAAARNALREFNQAIEQDEHPWIRDPFPGGVGPVFELSEPQQRRWQLAIAAPWAPGNTPRPSEPTDRLRLQVPLGQDWEPDDLKTELEDLTAPGYWALITEYAELKQHGLLLDSRARLEEFAGAIEAEYGETEDPRLRDLREYLTPSPNMPLPYIVPHFALVADDRPVLKVAGADAGEARTVLPSLQLKAKGSFVPRRLDRAIDGDDFPVIAPLYGSLDSALRSLTNGETGAGALLTSTLILSPGEGRTADAVRYNWSNVRTFAGELPTSIEAVAHLNRLLATLPERGALEGDLDQALAEVQDSAKVLDQQQAYDFLRRIWQIKYREAGLKIPQPKPDLASFTVAGQRRLSSTRVFRDKDVAPTIFAEYFQGPRSTYAIVWSASPDSGRIDEGPSLVHVAANADLFDPHTGKLNASPGSNLFGRVFDQVEQAIKRPGGGILALALAPEQSMALWPTDLAQVDFAPRSTRLAALDPNLDASAIKTWATIEDLRNGTCAKHLSQYTLMSSLLSDAESFPSPETSGEGLRWAIATLATAMQNLPVGEE